MPVCKRCKKHSNCLTIDPCEHCGEKDWDEATVLTSTKTSGSSRPLEGYGCLVAVVVLIAIVFGAYYFFIAPDNELLANKYNVPVNRVNAPPKPHGCAYNDAPLGDKHCHYDKYVYVYDKNGRAIQVNGKPQTCPAGCGPAYSVEQVFVRVED
jgi:hypothetical protein